MKRRNFLKKLGIGAVVAPVAIKSLGDQKAKKYHGHVPEKVRVYKGKPEDFADGSVSSVAYHMEGVIATFSEDGKHFIYDLKTGQIIRRS